jgi:Zn-dependent peptidase ImmA (M78 family)
MSKFRLIWARQCGEKKARDTGFQSFPVDPFRIAEDEGIHIEEKPADVPGVSGGIIFHEEQVAIFYAASVQSNGFRRFTVAHELGHYFLEGHPEEILKAGIIHASRAGFTEGTSSIELEADHFAAGLLMPSRLVRELLGKQPVGLEGIEELAAQSQCSLTASAIRAAECSPYPMAIIVSQGDSVRYSFMSDPFKQLGKMRMLKKGALLPDTTTLDFNRDPANVEQARRVCGLTDLNEWFDGPSRIVLDEEVIGLGRYGFTLTILSNEELPDAPDDEEDEEAALIDSYTPKFAYGR